MYKHWKEFSAFVQLLSNVKPVKWVTKVFCLFLWLLQSLCGNRENTFCADGILKKIIQQIGKHGK